MTAMSRDEARTWVPAPPVARYMPDREPHAARREMLERVNHGSTVLDVGCWSGAAGMFLSRQRSVTIDGVEPEDTMAERASGHYRTVYRSTIEHALDELIADRHRAYDAILFLDVLEHLTDPRQVLASCVELLRPGGRALVSIPNVAHWSVRWELLRGRWRYRNHGLLDRTHLRFFTKSTAIELARAAGWQVTWQDFCIDQPPLLRLSEPRLRVFAWWPTLFAVQFVLELRPINPEPAA